MLNLKANIDEVVESGKCKVKVKHVFVVSSPESQLSQLASSSATGVMSDIQPESLKAWDIDLRKVSRISQYSRLHCAVLYVIDTLSRLYHL